MVNFRIHQVSKTTSTNDDAKAAAEAGEAEGLVITAARQTAGRGRHGRAWQSPEGNLHCSILLRPPGLPQTAGLYSFVAALAVRDAVVEFLPRAAVTLKWPNDVLVDGKKIAGILLEAGTDYLVIGIGLNVAHHSEGALYPSTSLYKECVGGEDGNVPLPLREGLGEGAFGNPNAGANGTPPHPTSPSRGEEFLRAGLEIDHILHKLLDHLQHWYGVMREDGFAPIRAAWLEHAEKGKLSVKLPNETLAGDFAGLDDQGRLRLRLEDGSERVLASGDVFPAV